MFPDRLIDRGNKADERIAAGPAVGEMEKGPQYGYEQNPGYCLWNIHMHLLLHYMKPGHMVEHWTGKGFRFLFDKYYKTMYTENIAKSQEYAHGGWYAEG